MEPRSFSDLVTFTRSTTGTFLNASGVLETAAVDVPRFEFDASGAPRGLLFEQQRVNIALRSADFANALWTKGGATVAASTVIAPDGTVANKLVESATTATHGLAQVGKTVAGNTRYCRSVFAKADGSGRLLYLETDSFGQWANAGNARYNLDTGTIDNASSILDGVGIEAYPDGWYRCWLVATTIASPVAVPVDVQLATSAGPSYAGDGVSGAYIWGYQFEAGDSPSSYVPTVAAQVTRAADLAFVAAAAWLQAGEGTLFAEVVHGSVPTPGSVGISEVGAAVLGTSGTGGRIALWLTAANQRPNGHVVLDGGATVFNANAGPALLPGGLLKEALAYKTDDFQFAATGQLSPEDTAGGLPTIDRLVLGARGVSSNHMQGHICRIKYYPRRLSAGELQALTA
ncbi:hypothetical protein D3C77_169870 [compost metagenome]